MAKGNVIAVLTGSKEMFNQFKSLLNNDEGDTEYVCILSWDDARGRLFSGYTCLINWYLIKNAEEVLSNIKSRLR